MTDYYELLGISRSLNVSLDALQQRYYELSRQLHPDRFMQKPEAERQRALDMSSALNDAYRTLKDPIKRAQYLLALEGFDIGEQRSKDVPPELLAQWQVTRKRLISPTHALNPCSLGMSLCKGAYPILDFLKRARPFQLDVRKRQPAL